MALGVTVDFNAHLGNIAGQIDTINAHLNRFQQHAESMSSRVNRAFGAIGVGISAAGIATFVKSGIDAADALNDMADRTGIAVEKLAGFSYAAKLADTDMESFSKAANKLSIYIAKNGDDMKALGISAKDPGDAFLQLADVFSKIEDPQRRAALGAAVLGKSYADMAPLLMQNSEALRGQIKTGQEMSGITAEQAKAAADFNDKIDQLGKKLSTLNMRVIGPLLPYLSATAEHFAYAAKEAKAFSDVFTADFWARVRGGSEAGLGVERIKSIDKEISAQQGVIDRIKKHPILSGLENYSLEEEQSKLERIIKRRGDLVKEVSIQNAKPVPAPPVVAMPSQAAINQVIGTGAPSEADKARTASVDQLAKKYDELVASMQKEVDLRGDNSNAAKMEYDIIHTSLAGLNEAQKLELLNLAAKKDAIELNIKAYAEYDQIIADGLELAAKQRADSASEADRLNQKFNSKSIDFNQGLSDALDARHTPNKDGSGMIIPNDAELKRVLDQMGKDYNGLTEDAKKSTDSMSEFAVQAAHNMQSSFADFLFDPFSKGMDGMAVGFLNVIRKMAADAAATQILGSLMGTKAGDGGGLLGAALSAVVGGVGSYFGGTSGVSVSAGNSQTFSDTMSSSGFWTKNANGNVFSGGSVIPFAQGGIFDKPTNFAMAGGKIGLLGEAGPEAIMPLTRGPGGKLGIMASGGGGNSTVNNVSITVQAANNENPASTGQKIAESFIRAIAKEEIATSARPGNRLNSITSF